MPLYTMIGRQNQIKVFISYSWTTPKHEQWVLGLAERLFGDGIVVVLDKWDLKEGHDKHVFMEQMVSDESILKVLVICDAAYQAKANVRAGGVGTESQLISKEVYENTSQEKFIPIITEYNSDNKPCMPAFMAGRMYIDLSSEEKFEDNYQKLVRNLYNKPELRKPVLGTPPAYITEDEPIILKTSHKVQEIKSALLNNKPIAKALIADYYDLFITALSDHRISGGNTREFDETVLKSIERMLPLRNDFIDFISILFKYQEDVDLDGLKEFFEKLYTFQHPPEDVNSYTDIDCDNYKFVCYELMLYFIAVLFKMKKFSAAAFFIHAQYFYKTRHQAELNYGDIKLFNSYVKSLDNYRKHRLVSNRISFSADLIKERSNRSDISFEELVKTDLTIYYFRSLESDLWPWFPRTSVYADYWSSSIDLFQKQISRQHFEKIKVLYDVNSIEELKAKIQKYNQDVADNKRRRYDSWEYKIPALGQVINIEQIGTLK